MLSVRDVVACAASLGRSLRVAGPMTRDDVLGTLRGLDMSDEDAEDVLIFALSDNLIVADGEVLHAGSPNPDR